MGQSEACLPSGIPPVHFDFFLGAHLHSTWLTWRWVREERHPPLAIATPLKTSASSFQNCATRDSSHRTDKPFCHFMFLTNIASFPSTLPLLWLLLWLTLLEQSKWMCWISISLGYYTQWPMLRRLLLLWEPIKAFFSMTPPLPHTGQSVKNVNNKTTPREASLGVSRKKGGGNCNSAVYWSPVKIDGTIRAGGEEWFCFWKRWRISTRGQQIARLPEWWTARAE